MTGPSHFEILLELLADEGAIEGPLYRGGDGPATAARRREVVRQVRESTEAQLTLFRLAWELTADAADSERQLRTDVVEFAATVRERFGVDLLAVAAAHRDRLPPEVPDELLAESRIRTPAYE